WAAAIDQAFKQAVKLFREVFSGIFSPAELPLAKLTLLAPDVAAPEGGDPSASTAPIKRVYFLKKFLPFLRERLSHRLIVDTLSGASSLSGDVTEVLLSDVFVETRAGTQEVITAIDTLEQIQQEPTTYGSADWKGYLVPPTDGSYTFASGVDAKPLTLDGESIAFKKQDDDTWWSAPQKLKGGRVYEFAVSGLTITGKPAQLQWKS